MQCTGNAPRALGAMVEGEGIVSYALAFIFFRRTRIEQQPSGLLKIIEYVVAADARRRVAGRRGIGNRRKACNLTRERPAFRQPFAAHAVEQAKVAMPGHGESPEGIGAELNRIAGEHDGGIRPDAHAAEQAGHGLRRNELAVGLVPARRFPVDPGGAGDMALAVGLVVVARADLDDAQILIRQMIFEPCGGDEWRWCHRHLPMHRVPTPWSVSNSSSTACGILPSMMTTPSTPWSSA